MAISKLTAALSVLAVIDAKKRPEVLFGDEVQEWDDEEPLVKKAHEKKVRPVVKSSGESMCLFKDANNSWCFAGSTPMIESGWTVYQEVLDGAWNIQF